MRLVKVGVGYSFCLVSRLFFIFFFGGGSVFVCFVALFLLVGVLFELDFDTIGMWIVVRLFLAGFGSFCFFITVPGPKHFLIMYLEDSFGNEASSLRVFGPLGLLVWGVYTASRPRGIPLLEGRNEEQSFSDSVFGGGIGQILLISVGFEVVTRWCLTVICGYSRGSSSQAGCSTRLPVLNHSQFVLLVWKESRGSGKKVFCFSRVLSFYWGGRKSTRSD